MAAIYLEMHFKNKINKWVERQVNGEICDEANVIKGEGQILTDGYMKFFQVFLYV